MMTVADLAEAVLPNDVVVMVVALAGADNIAHTVMSNAAINVANKLGSRDMRSLAEVASTARFDALPNSLSKLASEGLNMCFLLITHSLIKWNVTPWI